MKDNKQNAVCSRFPKAVLPMAILGLSLAAPIGVQAQGSGAQLEEIIVSARRQQESVQEVPISITVFNQEQLHNQNVFSGADLAAYTPSLAVNTRFGPDQASFAIRGFTQELRTTASVGFYFAEVVAPRGGVGSVTAGDGAGPGAFFDLQDVLVLKGPQGTLFGRNTTGGAIMLTPQEPTTALEGYIEASGGDYDMRRLQGVINIPMGERVRARFGVDTMERDGYLKNVSGVGPSRLGDVDYIAARASIIIDVTDTLQNYTIASYTDSENNGMVNSLFACNPSGALFNWGCGGQLAHQGDDFYNVESLTPKPKSALEQWQVINTTTWEATDNLTIRNILSYADLEQWNNTSVYGINFDFFGMGQAQFTESNSAPGIPTNSQTSFVEELQFQGYAFDSRLTWQAGLYYENSKPDGWSNSLSVNQLFCNSVDRNNPAASQCVDIARMLGFLGSLQSGTPGDPIGGLFGPGGYGAISNQLGKMEYTNKAAYGEATFDITDQFKVTGGLRYTHDKTEGTSIAQVWNGFPFMGTPATGFIAMPGTPGSGVPGYAGTRCTYSVTTLAEGCRDGLDTTSEAFTGLINFDYLPTQDTLLYAKYSRGYRQGSLNLFGGEGLRAYEPEFVNAFELGAKTKFGGAVPGTFNVALFYNELKEQQLQYGAIAAGVPPSTAIINAGSSVIQGLEVESSFRLLDDLMLNLSYTYLDTKLKEVDEVNSTPTVSITASSLEGGDLTFSPRHSLVANLNYMLPVPETLGDVSVGVTYSYTDEQYATSPEYTSGGRLSGSPYGKMPSYELVNFNLNWDRIAGTNFDASLFMTNAFDEEYIAYVPGNYHSLGFEMRNVGVPKMWGARLRYTFGD